MTDRNSNVEFTDQQLVCKDCGDTFTWYSGEQEYFATKGLQQPKRCRRCREHKREQKGQSYVNQKHQR